MSDWEIEIPITVVKRYSIYGMIGNFLKYDNTFRLIRPDETRSLRNMYS